MVGVPAGTIRTWEERYGVIQPERTAGGHRLYSRDQVEQIRFVAKEVGRGVQPGPAHRLLEDAVAADPQSARRRSPEARLLIMLAERDPYAGELSDYFLRTEGYDVELVFDAAEAERTFDALSPDLAVVELLISGGDGFELTRRLKARGDVPVLAISPLDARDRALAAGADAFLIKPFEPLGLISSVKDLLGASAFLRGDSARDQLTT
jgi:CheY-like chemotaxis protein